MNPISEHALQLTRREFFGRSACGLGTAALASLLGREPAFAAEASPSNQRPFPGLDSLPHFAPKAKRVIYLFQNGAPTHVELFDFKPTLQSMHGKPMHGEFFAGKRFSTMTGDPAGKLVLGPV